MANIIGTLPVTLQNGTTADATQVMADFNFIVSQVNANGLSTSFIAPGTLLNVQVFTSSATYTPNVNATKAIVRAMGGGGAGGGTLATSGGQAAAGVGGGAGAYLEGLINTGLTSQTVTIGNGGSGVSGGIGGAGGATSFGTTFIAGGGGGGNAGANGTPPNQLLGGGAGGVCSGSGLILVAGRGQAGAPGYTIGISAVMNGFGGSTQWGSGGTLNSGAAGFGAGGAGAGVGQNAAAAAGNPGSLGILLVYEFA